MANSIRDYSENHDEIDEGSVEAISYSVKYLGNSIVSSSKSEEGTAKAIKNIISSAKSMKKLQRVSLSISPKGIEMMDPVTLESLLQVSIYKISYCSADAQHSNVFAFVGSSNNQQENDYDKPPNFKEPSDATDAEGSLVCYAFLCQKKKMAQTVTLTVARSFERAYQIWQNQQFHAELKRKSDGTMNKRNKDNSLQAHNSQIIERQNSVRSLLIDFNSELATELYSKDHRDYFQNTWVSSSLKLKYNFKFINWACFSGIF